MTCLSSMGMLQMQGRKCTIPKNLRDLAKGDPPNPRKLLKQAQLSPSSMAAFLLEWYLIAIQTSVLPRAIEESS